MCIENTWINDYTSNISHSKSHLASFSWTRCFSIWNQNWCVGWLRNWFHLQSFPFLCTKATRVVRTAARIRAMWQMTTALDNFRDPEEKLKSQHCPHSSPSSLKRWPPEPAEGGRLIAGTLNTGDPVCVQKGCMPSLATLLFSCLPIPFNEAFP